MDCCNMVKKKKKKKTVKIGKVRNKSTQFAYILKICKKRFVSLSLQARSFKSIQKDKKITCKISIN